ncbi:MAG: Anion transporter [Alcaligenaceae bacterium]|nr:Anion transporter [Alcaligenaceae bacterium]
MTLRRKVQGGQCLQKMAPWRFVFCSAVGIMVWYTVPASVETRLGLGLFVFIGLLWITQALHLVVTALLVPLLAAILGLMPVKEGLSSFANPTIFLFMGGFALAAALATHGLDRALALFVLRLSKGQQLRAVLLLCGLTALLSMWMSNTATVAMMLPLALGLLAQHDGANTCHPRTQAFILLALAYSASIGGMGTIVGSPPNAIVAAYSGITFAQWMVLALPVVALFWPLMLLVLWLILRPEFSHVTVSSNAHFQWSQAKTKAVAIFLLTVFAWIMGGWLAPLIGISGDFDTVVALAAIVALAGFRVVSWSDLQKNMQWGVLLLFGGGIALGQVMAASGASAYLAEIVLGNILGLPVWLIITVIVACVVFLTEFVSNTASAALLMPLLAPVAVAMGVPPLYLGAAIALSASCAFMLPVATPPNALVFATDRVPQPTMMRCGFALNLMCIAVLASIVYLWW